MSHSAPSHVTIEALAEENARLRGEALATGIILAQLLQSMARKELSPHGFVTKIMEKARKGVEGFDEPGSAERKAIARKSALDTVKSYEDQIRSVLPI
jgi:hypothetical protein